MINTSNKDLMSIGIVTIGHGYVCTKVWCLNFICSYIHSLIIIIWHNCVEAHDLAPYDLAGRPLSCKTNLELTAHNARRTISDAPRPARADVAGLLFSCFSGTTAGAGIAASVCN